MVNVRKLNKEEFGKVLLPEKLYKFNIRDELERSYERLYYDNLNYSIISNFFFLSVLIALVLYVLLVYPFLYVQLTQYFTSYFLWKFILIFFSWLITNLFVYFILILFYFFYLDSKESKEEREVEEALPEFIENLVSNIKGGISLEKALVKSVRPEQKALRKEVMLVNQKIMMGEDVLDAIREFRKRFSSPVLTRTLFLIEEGLRGGGELAEPLEKISQNLKNIYNLNDEIKANSGGFAIVIRVLTIFVAPLLFALAITLLTFIGDLFSILGESNVQKIPVSEVPSEFSDYLTNFSYAMIGLITFFSSMITSQIKNERVYESLKYLPIYVGVALLLFVILSNVLLGFFGGIIG